MSNPSLFDHLKNLISFDTTFKNGTTEIVRYLEAEAQRCGFTTFALPSAHDKNKQNLLCQAGPLDKDGLIISGHMDVVPVESQTWHSDPFTLSEKDDVYIGRGTTDMKGFIASSLAAFSSIDVTKLEKQLVLLWTYDEEVGCVGSGEAASLLGNYLQKVPTKALIGEPTDFKIFRMHAGHTTIKITAKGRGAHSSNPDLGISAIKALNGVINEINALERALQQEIHLPEHFERPYVTMNIGQIGGGSAINIVPDEAWMTLGFRPLPDIKSDAILDRIHQTIAKASLPAGAQIITQLINEAPPMLTKSGTELEQWLSPYANKAKGSAALFATDGGNLSKLGIETLIFGPGSIDVAHQANEWVKKADLEECQSIIEKLIASFLYTRS